MSVSMTSDKAFWKWLLSVFSCFGEHLGFEAQYSGCRLPGVVYVLLNC